MPININLPKRAGDYCNSEMDMGWVNPWVGSQFWQIVWVGLDRLNHVNFISVIAVAVHECRSLG